MKNIFSFFLLLTALNSFAGQDKKVRRPATSDLEIELSVHKSSSLEAIASALKEIKIVRDDRDFYPMLCAHMGFIRGAVGITLTDNKGQNFKAVIEGVLGSAVFSKKCTYNDPKDYELLKAGLATAKLDKLIAYVQNERDQLD